MSCRRGVLQTILYGLPASTLSPTRCPRSFIRPIVPPERGYSKTSAQRTYHASALNTTDARATCRKRKCATHQSQARRSSQSGHISPPCVARTYSTLSTTPDSHAGVFIALGSNVGDRFQAVADACRAIDSDPDMHIVRTSPLFETEPMYVEDQGRFLNGVCEVSRICPDGLIEANGCKIATSLSPIDLLDRLQAIENRLGRVKLIDKGPRNIDLDILLYRNEKIDSERLKIPHPLILERAFVLRPLASLGKVSLQPLSTLTADEALEALPYAPMYPCVPLGPHMDPLRINDESQAGLIMAILNTTPDSFSDGGDNSLADRESIRSRVAADIAAGATIIDVGGQSSRPHADDVSSQEELSRVLPAIEVIKSVPEADQIAISVDTYRASVAEAAVRAGADIVNDISAGTLDSEMLPTVARLDCTYIMMHMRGSPATMQSECNTAYPSGLVPTVSSELLERIDAAQKAGIRQWRIILDPGFGFAKTVTQNVQLLAQFQELRKSDLRLRQYPFLVGVSRKGFIGKVTRTVRPKERLGGTAAAVTLAALQGAEIHRVHDVGQMAQAVRLAEAARRVG